MSDPAVSAPTVAPPGVVAMVTGNDLLARLDHVSESLAKIETQVSTLPVELAATRALTERNAESIARLERWRSYLTGAGAVVLLIFTSGLAVALVRAFTHTH